MYKNDKFNIFRNLCSRVQKVMDWGGGLMIKKSRCTFSDAQETGKKVALQSLMLRRPVKKSLMLRRPVKKSLYSL